MNLVIIGPAHALAPILHQAIISAVLVSQGPLMWNIDTSLFGYFEQYIKQKVQFLVILDAMTPHLTSMYCKRIHQCFADPPITYIWDVLCQKLVSHYGDIIMGAIASQITSLTIVYSTVNSDADQRKHQSSASLAFVRGIHWGLMNSPHKWPVTRKMFSFDDVIMKARVKYLHSTISFRCIAATLTKVDSNINKIDIKLEILQII